MPNKSVMHTRLLQSEIIDDPSLPARIWDQVHYDLDHVHRWLGNYRAIFSRLHRARSVIDIGCGNGALLRRYLRARRGVRAVGVDLRPPLQQHSGIAFLALDATCELLPEADAAVSLCVLHHLTEAQIIALIRNSSRSVRRLILVDLVRHHTPLWLFRRFVAPLVHPITAADGITSIQRAWTPGELAALVHTAVHGTGARCHHAVAPFGIRQVVEITWP